MKIIKLSKLAAPDEYLFTILHVYTAMLHASEKENNLRQYVISSLMVKQIDQAKDMLSRSRGDRRYYCYHSEPFVYSVEDSDTVADIMSFRDCYVYNPAMAY